VENDPATSVTRWLVQNVSVRPRDRVLEIAAGSGTVGSALTATSQPEILVLTDLDSVSLATAGRRRWIRSQHGNAGRPAIGFFAADMLKLPFPDSTFDAAVCRWGFMFASVPKSAFVEARRVLRPGGRLAFAVWGKAVENPWQSVLDDALALYGIEDRTRKLEPGGMFGLSDETALRALLREAGFVVRTSEKLELPRHYRDFDDYWAQEVDCGTSRPAALGAMGPEDAESFRHLLETSLSSYKKDTQYVIPGANIVVTAKRSAGKSMSGTGE
jgi:SAM-dependent methyltransferase